MQSTYLNEHLPLAAVDFLVLVCLLQEDSYGYKIVHDIRDRSEGQIDLLPGNLYSVLRRMERSGMLQRSGRRVPGDGGRPRSYYRISTLGRGLAAAEARRLTQLVETSDVRELVTEPSR